MWSLTYIAGSLRSPRGSSELDYTQYIGKRLGEKALGRSVDLNRILILIPNDMPEDSPAIRSYLDGIRRALKPECPKVEFIMGPVRYDPMAEQEGLYAINPDDFADLLRNKLECPVIISLIGFPELSPSVQEAWQIRKPFFIAFAAVAPPLDSWFAAGILQAALVARPPELAAPSEATGSMESRFERDFVFLTP